MISILLYLILLNFVFHVLFNKHSRYNTTGKNVDFFIKYKIRVIYDFDSFSSTYR